MTLVLGVDLGTQSTKVVVCDADSGEVLRSGSAPHPDATEVEPGVWWDAFTAAGGGLLDDGSAENIAAMGVAGQQHGMVCLDERGDVVRPALLWNDIRSAGAATELVADLGGPAAWAHAVGSVPVASFTVTKLRWFARSEPKLADRTASVLLPHDWLTDMLREHGSPTTDRGDASGTGYWSPAMGTYRPDLVELAFGRELALPRVAGPAEVVGETSGGAVLSAGTGDNMAAALGLGLGPGDAVVSIGTSGTVFAVAQNPVADPSGIVAGFADATGRYLPLVCTLNAARVLTATADLLGVPLSTVDDLALSAVPGAGGLTLLPYLDGERTPNLPAARGLLAGLTRTNASPANLARAAVEGLLCGLADGLDALRGQGVPVERILLIGGGAGSKAVRALAPALLGAPVAIPRPAEYVALGAARQAAWALRGGAAPPEWPVRVDSVTAEPTEAVRVAYGEVRTRAAGLLK